MKFLRLLLNYLLIMSCAVSLIGCASQNSREQVGAVAGGIAGGILGGTVFHGHGHVPGIIGGAIIGSMLGSAVGQSMDEQDRLNAEQAIINVPIGEEARWVNEDSGITYTIRPIKAYRTGGKYCRRAVTRIYLDGQVHKAYTTVCRVGNGPWQVQ